MIVCPLIVMLLGWMSPIASFATNAYGTLAISLRGVISASSPTWMPRYFVFPSRIGVRSWFSPSDTEKKPFSNVTSNVSVHTGFASFGPL
jgi:hypothetical protein